MTAETGVERRLVDHYADEPPLRAPDRLLIGALAAIESTPQRRGVLAPWRHPAMRNYERLAAAAALIVVIGAGAIALWPRLGIGDPAPTATPSPAPTPTPLPGPTLGALSTVNLVAINIAFDRPTLDVPANEPFVIHFRNADVVGIVHDVDIRRADETTVVLDQVAIEGGTQAEYRYDALPAGDYVFICSFHPIAGMTGTLRVR